MWKYILKRLGIAVVTILIILLILFVLLEFMPGTPFDMTEGNITDEQIEVLYAKYGLDKPVLYRFVLYVKNMLSGDFGVSYVIQNNMPISQMLEGRLTLSIKIGAQAMLIGTLFGLILGIFAALKHNTPLDSGATLLSMIGASVPSYVFALGLAYVFAFKLKWVPLLYNSKKEFISTILPTIALSFSPIASIARYSRTEMIEVMDSDYIQLAESKGLSRFVVIVRHGLRNAMITILTIMGPMLVSLMTGSTVVESIFSVPGVGNLFINALQVNDYNVTITLAFIFSAEYILMMLFVDVMYGIIDPRIRVSGGKKA
ncbi:MAG: ABC transporter permease [Lachnospiraceae bacterium]|nr:ABC transporter permease [Lachnospiraceae bacterium]